MEDFVTLEGPEGGRLAKIPAEEAIKLAHEILDAASKALKDADRLHEYD